MKFLALTLYLLAGVTLQLISASAIIVCFRKYDFRAFNLVIWNSRLLFTFMYALFAELFEE